MANIPETMRSLVAPKKGPPSTFEIASMPTPSIKEPTDVLIHVRAASLGTGDVQIAGGKLEVFYKATFV
jgi:NADPH:quinone reductase-like Zn-dependent oxidoreductase